MTTNISTLLTFEDLSKVLNISADNYSDVIDSLLLKYMEVAELEKREVYRFRFSDVDSVALSVSDITDILETKSDNNVILDLSLKYQLENNNTTAAVLMENKPINLNDIKSAKNTEELLGKIKGLDKIESVNLMSLSGLPYLMKGFAIKGGPPTVGVNISLSHLPRTNFYNVEWPDNVLTININISISNYKSRYMR